MPIPARAAKVLLPAFLAFVVVASASVAGAAAVAPRVLKQGPVYRLDRGTVAYDFDSAWRTETLWEKDSTGVWHRVPGPETARLEPFRRLLLHRIGRDSLDQVPREGEAELQSLRALGYL